MSKKILKKLSRLSELIDHPIVRSTIPGKVYGQIRELLNQIDHEGLKSVSDNAIEQLQQLADEYEGNLKEALRRPPAFIAVLSGNLNELERVERNRVVVDLLVLSMA